MASHKGPQKETKDDYVYVYVLGKTEKKALIKKVNEDPDFERSKKAVFDAVCGTV
jgi:hypothetical protein